MIEVSGLVFAYPGAKAPAVDDLGFSVADAEIFGFLGPNGAGKSTTQKVLTGLLRDYRGRASVLEREVRDWGSELYEQIGVGFELPVHYGRLTARENLRYFAALYRGETADPDELLEQGKSLDGAEPEVRRIHRVFENLDAIGDTAKLVDELGDNVGLSKGWLRSEVLRGLDAGRLPAGEESIEARTLQ